MNELEKEQTTIFGIKEIRSILPHRYPFLLVDRVIKLDLENNSIIGVKCVTANEPFFEGHFPEAPIMPGVLILEALAQTGGILIHEKGYKDNLAVLLSVNHAKFRKPVFPGDCLYLYAEALHIGSRGGKVNAKAFVKDKLVAQAEIGFALTEKDHI